MSSVDWTKLDPRRLSRRSRWLALLLLAVLTALALYAPSIIELAYYIRLAPEVSALPELAPAGPEDRILVIAPHPDDETLGCGGYILAARQAGAEVHILWLTCGDGFERDEVMLAHQRGPAAMLELGRQRAAEARAAAASLGVPAENLHFLGYPDGGMLRLFLDYYIRPYRSHYTHKSAVPYGFALHPGAAYTGLNAERDLESVYASVKPSLVLAPAVEDAHPDHRAGGMMALRLLGARGALGSLRFYMVHGGLEWPIPKGYHRRLPLEVPQRGRNLRWSKLSLSPEMENAKWAALKEYKSQLKVMRTFIEAYVRTNELQAFPETLPATAEAEGPAARALPATRPGSHASAPPG